MRLRPFVALLPFLIACSENVPTAPSLTPSYARGGSGGGGTTTGITPVQLGNLKQLNCTKTGVYSISDASPSTAGGYCVRNGVLSPFLWSQSGSAILSDTGIVREVAADGTGFGEKDFKPFKWKAGSSPLSLPLPSDRTWGGVSAINASGTAAFGNAQYSVGTTTYIEPASWTFDGSSWSAENPGFIANDMTPAGDAAVGTYGNRATRWTLSSGSWVRQTLPDNGAISSTALGINQNGTVVVGTVELPNTADPTKSHHAQAAWLSDGAGGWTLKYLGGFNVIEGQALAVATQLDGSVVAVGWAWEDLSGPNAQDWAVAWKLPAGATQFNAPTRLSPVSKGFGATAYDINSRGEIVGIADTNTSSVAVMWKLP